MPNEKISELTDGSPAQANDQIPVNRGGANVRINAGTISGTSPIKTVTVTLTAAQLKALNASPVTLVAAQGVGKVVVSDYAFVQYKAGATPYTINGGTFIFLYSGSTTLPGNGVAASGFIDQATNQITTTNLNDQQTYAQTVGENKAYTIGNFGGTEFTLGDGIVIVTLYYSVVTLA